jgi:hypothetical protein
LTPCAIADDGKLPAAATAAAAPITNSRWHFVITISFLGQS